MKSLIALFLAVGFWSVPALAQANNEVSLVIGGIVGPGQTLSPGTSFTGPGGTVLPNRDITFKPSLTLGAEYDRVVVQKQRVAIGGGVDFLASPFGGCPTTIKKSPAIFRIIWRSPADY
jgi:hypothetical protein